MILKKISYSRVFSLPGYENEKIGVEIELESGDNLDQVFESAKAIVFAQSPEATKSKKNEERLKLIETLERIVNNPEDYTETECAEAISRLRELKNKDLPF